MNKNGKSKILIFFGVIIALIFILIAIGIFFIYSKWSKIEFEELDTSDLNVTTDIYNNVSNIISQEEFDDIITIALFGIDSRDTYNMDAGRSDTIIIASINPKIKSVKLISIPRDTYVNIEGYGKTKINHAYAYGKEQLSIKTINSNFGLNITEYVTIDFSGLINVINSIGGININITEEEMNFINQVSPFSYKFTGNNYQKLTHYGNVILSGEQALAHSRNRTVGNDFARAERQRIVLEALINKLVNMDINDIISLLDSFLSEVRTNINPTKYINVLTSVLKDKNEYLNNVISVQIPNSEYASGKMIEGVYYFVSDLDIAKKDMYRYLYEK